MQKTVFLFRRKATRSREDFGAYYVNNHAVLGRRLTVCLRGYTVNLVRNRDGPDAVTEHWLPSADHLFTPSLAYTSQEDFQAVVDDDSTLFDGFELYIVSAEKFVIAAPPCHAPLERATPETKAIWLFRDAAALPPPPTGARRVIDNCVSHKLVAHAKVPSDVAVIRMAWGPDLAVTPGDDCLIVDEHRFIAPPEPDWNWRETAA